VGTCENEYYDFDSARIASNLCHKLKISENITKMIKFLILNHRVISTCKTAANFRFIIKQCECDRNSIDKLIKFTREHNPRLTKKINSLTYYSNQTKLGDLISPLDGNEIMEVSGIKMGKIIGKIKNHLTNLVIDGTIKSGDKESAKEFVKKYLEDV
jgi:tRNA nucleotidyltransferase/poly(A) polymerase